MEFIHKHDVPLGAKVTYTNFICDERLFKEEKYTVILVVGGDKLVNEDDAGSPVVPYWKQNCWSRVSFQR